MQLFQTKKKHSYGKGCAVHVKQQNTSKNTLQIANENIFYSFISFLFCGELRNNIKNTKIGDTNKNHMRNQ